MSSSSITTIASSNILEFKQPEPRGYFQLCHAVLGSTNWQSLPKDARLAFIEIAGKYRRYNNGNLLLSKTDAMEAFGIGHPKASRTFDALERHGFAFRRQQGTWEFRTKEEQLTKWELSAWVLGQAVGCQPAPNGGVLGAAAGPNKKILESRIDKNRDSCFEEGKKEGCPRGPEGGPKEASHKPESGPSAPSVDPQALLQTTAREVTRGTPRSRRAWQFTSPEQAAEAEATLARYREAAAKANGGGHE